MRTARGMVCLPLTLTGRGSTGRISGHNRMVCKTFIQGFDCPIALHLRSTKFGTTGHPRGFVQVLIMGLIGSYRAETISNAFVTTSSPLFSR